MKSNYNKKHLKVSDTLIFKIANYDSLAFEQLYKEASGAVFGLAMSIVMNYDDASDVVQNTFITIYEKAKNYRSEGKAMAWIFTIARNHALMLLRSKAKHSHNNLDDVYDVGVESTIENDIHNEELITELLQELQEDERQIVIMHAMSNMKHKDIAKELKLPLSTVLSKYRRSMQKLKQYMEVNEYEK